MLASFKTKIWNVFCPAIFLCFRMVWLCYLNCWGFICSSQIKIKTYFESFSYQSTSKPIEFPSSSKYRPYFSLYCPIVQLSLKGRNESKWWYSESEQSLKQKQFSSIVSVSCIFFQKKWFSLSLLSLHISCASSLYVKTSHGVQLASLMLWEKWWHLL